MDGREKASVLIAMVAALSLIPTGIGGSGGILALVLVLQAPVYLFYKGYRSVESPTQRSSDT